MALIILSLVIANLLVLAFMAGAKRLSYTPEEIEAEYDLQYRQLNA
jgi:hypothetical protein